VDVAGYNYMEALYDGDHAKYPGRVIFGSENGHEPAQWMAVKRNAFIAGQFLWTGADFLGEAKGWPVRVSMAGLLTTANDEKPLYYHRRALWTDALCAKLAASASGNPYEETFCWRYRTGETISVSCYTNAAEATLYLNDRPVGTVPVGEDARAVWRVPYEAGELRVSCRRGGETVGDALVTPGAPAKLALTCDRPALAADGRSVATLRIAFLDAQGRLVADENTPCACRSRGT
jgi:hypothetical protein